MNISSAKNRRMTTNSPLLASVPVRSRRRQKSGGESLVADVPGSFARRLTDPIFVNPPARLYTLGGVANGHGGANRFSTIDFFGEQLNRTHFIVVNDEKFRNWASAFLEAKFRAENPHPDWHLAGAFTHYMHDSNLHWSGCTERSKANAT